MVDNSDNERKFASGAKIGKRSGFEPAESGARNSRMAPEIEEDVNARVSGTYNRRQDTQETLTGETSEQVRKDMVNAAIVGGVLILGTALVSKAVELDENNQRPGVEAVFKAVEMVDGTVSSAARNFAQEVKEHVPELVVGVIAVGAAAIKGWQKLNEWAKSHEQEDNKGKSR